MENGTRVCELCGMHKKVPLGHAGAMWMETDAVGGAWLVVEPVCGRTLPVMIPAWYCPACGRNLNQNAEGEADNGTDA